MTHLLTPKRRTPVRACGPRYPVCFPVFLVLAVIGLLSALTVSSTAAQVSLKGGKESLDRQNRVARQHDYTYLGTGAQARRFRDQGLLVNLRGNSNYRIHAVSFPFARPGVKTFVERLSRQYRASCGEQLVVTSLTRPKNSQPPNASARSVHPTGMAIDLRIPSNGTCRSWLERVLLQLERSGVIEATRERRPPHYHIAVFPTQYLAYVDRLEAADDSAPNNFTKTASPLPSTYVVRRGDTLWEIARTHNTTVGEIRRLNLIDGTRIDPGQSLALPRSSR